MKIKKNNKTKTIDKKSKTILKKGYVYVMTNPIFKDGIVKIGFANDVEKRRRDLSGTSIPYDYRILATFQVNNRLSDKTLHKIIDKLNPDIRIREKLPNGKIKEKEFFTMSNEDAIELLKDIALFSNQSNKVKIWPLTKDQKKEDNEIKNKAPFRFSMIKLKPGETINFMNYKNIRCKVINDKEVEYKGRKYSLSALAVLLLKRFENKNWTVAHGPRFFCYKGKKLCDMRETMNN